MFGDLAGDKRPTPPVFDDVEFEKDRPGRGTLWAASWRGQEALGPNPHVHPGLEVGVVLAGSRTVYHPELTIELYPGDVFLWNAWEPHATYMPLGTESVTLVFAPAFIGDEMLGGASWLAPFAMPPEERVRQLAQSPRDRLQRIGREMQREIETAEPYWRSAVRFHLLQLLVEVVRLWEGGALPRTGPGDLVRVVPAFSLLHSRPWRRVSTAQGAAACGLSRSRFHDVFKRATGTAFGAFALRARLAFCANRLVHTDRPVAAVAAEAGFVDPSHFRRRFLALYGCTPIEYRRKRGAWRRQYGAAMPRRVAS